MNSLQMSQYKCEGRRAQRFRGESCALQRARQRVPARQRATLHASARPAACLLVPLLAAGPDRRTLLPAAARTTAEEEGAPGRGPGGPREPARYPPDAAGPTAVAELVGRPATADTAARAGMHVHARTCGRDCTRMDVRLHACMHARMRASCPAGPPAGRPARPTRRLRAALSGDRRCARTPTAITTPIRSPPAPTSRCKLRSPQPHGCGIPSMGSPARRRQRRALVVCAGSAGAAVCGLRAV